MNERLPLPSHISASVRRLNPNLYVQGNPPINTVSNPEPQQAVRNDALAASPRKEGHTARIHVRVVSYRLRLIDPDNLCAKYFVDACRYAGFIPDDSAKDIEYSISQEKVNTKELQRTEIVIEMREEAP